MISQNIYVDIMQQYQNRIQVAPAHTKRKICLVFLVNSNINHPLENMLYHNLITRSVYKTLMVSLHSKNMTDLAWTKRTEHIFHVGNVCCPLLKAELGGRKKSTPSAIC